MASRQQSRRQQPGRPLFAFGSIKSFLVTTSKSGLRPKEIAQLMEEADKWELNQETVFKICLFQGENSTFSSEKIYYLKSTGAPETITLDFALLTR